MAEGTTFRLDTADAAIEFGWHVESTRHADEFNRDGVIIAVQYSPDDDISSLARWGTNREHEVVGHDSVGKHERLRTWLADRVPIADKSATQPSKSRVDLSQKSGGRFYWEFWEQFRSRVATEHPEWRGREGPSRFSPNSTLPAGTPGTIFCSAFKPGPLRLELAFTHRDPAVNLARFEALLARKDQFEEALGENVVWDEMPGRKDSRLYVTSLFDGVEDAGHWTAMMDWLIDHHVRFRRAIVIVGGLEV